MNSSDRLANYSDTFMNTSDRLANYYKYYYKNTPFKAFGFNMSKEQVCCRNVGHDVEIQPPLWV